MADNNNLRFDVFYNIVGSEKRTSETLHRCTNPATEEDLWSIPVASSADVEDAASAAQQANKEWSQLAYPERARMLEKFADEYLKYAPQFIELLQAETGRTAEIAAIEVYWSANWLRYPSTLASDANAVPGLTSPHILVDDDEKIARITYTPCGVVAAICPWNYPIILAFGKIAPAVAVGNCVILKPSPFTPYTSMKFVELAQSIFPPGVLQVVADDGRLGPLLVEQPQVNHISFTGSIATGKKIMQTAASATTMKKLTLELGGNDAAVVLEDVDIDRVAPQVAMGAWWNSGQSCIAVKRVYIQASIYDKFVQALVTFTKSVKAAAVASKDEANGVVIPPIQNKIQFNKLQALIEESRRHGHKFATIDNGKNTTATGLFMAPVIIDNPPQDSELVVEEQFGPILPCMSVATPEEAIAAVNATPTGLSATVFATDIERAQAVADQLDVGSVFINGGGRPDPAVPFSGHKWSGQGVEYGVPGLLEYCHIKSTVIYK